jgi:hypothetical protein
MSMSLERRFLSMGTFEQKSGRIPGAGGIQGGGVIVTSVT